MAKEFTIKNSEELPKIMESKDYEISKSIIDSVLRNLNNKKKHIHVISIFCEEEGDMFDLTLERNNFLSVLKLNLPTFEKHEDYEGCIKIQNAINQLNSL